MDLEEQHAHSVAVVDENIAIIAQAMDMTGKATDAISVAVQDVLVALIVVVVEKTFASCATEKAPKHAIHVLVLVVTNATHAVQQA